FTVNGDPSGVQVSASYAPFYSTEEAREPSFSLPVPRFVDAFSYLPCVSGPCITVAPTTGMNSGPVTVSISGGPILNGAFVKLSGTAVPDIAGSSMQVSSSVLNTTFNLTGAPAGVRDVVITPVTGQGFVLKGAFSILGVPTCSYVVGPLNPSFS